MRTLVFVLVMSIFSLNLKAQDFSGEYFRALFLVVEALDNQIKGMNGPVHRSVEEQRRILRDRQVMAGEILDSIMRHLEKRENVNKISISSSEISFQVVKEFPESLKQVISKLESIANLNIESIKADKLKSELLMQGSEIEDLRKKFNEFFKEESRYHEKFNVADYVKGLSVGFKILSRLVQLQPFENIEERSLSDFVTHRGRFAMELAKVIKGDLDGARYLEYGNENLRDWLDLMRRYLNQGHHDSWDSRKEAWLKVLDSQTEDFKKAEKLDFMAFGGRCAKASASGS